MNKLPEPDDEAATPAKTEAPSQMPTTRNGRGPRRTPKEEAPFAWQAKAALRAITRGERVANRAHALAVYVVLSMLLSDGEANEVTCTKGYLASIAGLGSRAVAQALLDLEALGLVQVQRQKVPGTRANAINTYRLASCTRCMRSGTKRGRSCTRRAPSRARNQNNKEGAPTPSLRIEQEKPPAADAASAGAPASQPVAPGRPASAFLMNGLDA